MQTGSTWVGQIGLGVPTRKTGVGQVKGIEGDFPMTFIRAPYIHRTLSPNVEILSVKAGHIVAVQQGRQLATAFHPELTSDDRLHRYFLDTCKIT